MNIRKTAAAILCALTLVSVATTILRKRRKVRRYKTRPLNRARHKYGHFETLVKFIKANDYEQFFKYTRLSPKQFEYLLNIMKPFLQKNQTKNPLCPAHRLCMTLHFLAEGCSRQQIAWDFYVGKTTVHCVVNETCELLWNVLSPVYIPIPNEEKWNAVERGFFNKWNMPHTLGALDGKHVNIQAPAFSGTDYFNYKKNFSLVIMAVCDAFYQFLLVDIGAMGSNHDSSVFKLSDFGKAVLNDNLNFPEDKPLPGCQDASLPFFFVADQAFPLHKRIMRPYPGQNLDLQKNIFNYRLSRARRTIENTFGILAQRWRILRRPIIGNISTCENITKACVVLHNFVQCQEEDIPPAERRYCPTGFADHVDEHGNYHLGQWRNDGFTLQSVGRIGANNSSQNIKRNRELLAKYFVTRHGSVSWQRNYVLRGSLPTL